MRSSGAVTGVSTWAKVCQLPTCYTTPYGTTDVETSSVMISRVHILSCGLLIKPGSSGLLESRSVAQLRMIFSERILPVIRWGPTCDH